MDKSIIAAENDAEIMRRKIYENIRKEQEEKAQRFNNLFYEVSVLNPSISFVRSFEHNDIIISAPIEKLKLPDGFEVKGNKIAKINIESIADLIEMSFIFKPTQVVSKTDHQNNSDEAEIFFEELVALNPDIDLEKSSDNNYIISSVPIEEMVLPKDFYNYEGVISDTNKPDSLQFPVYVKTKTNSQIEYVVIPKDENTLNKKKQKHTKGKTKLFSRVHKFITRIWNSNAVEYVIKKPARFVKNGIVKLSKYIGKGFKKGFASSKNFITRITKKRKQEIVDEMDYEEELEEAIEIDRILVIETKIEDLKREYEEELAKGDNANKLLLECILKEIDQFTLEAEELKAVKSAKERQEAIKKIVEEHGGEVIEPNDSIAGYSFDALKNVYNSVSIISYGDNLVAIDKASKKIYLDDSIVLKRRLATLMVKVNGENVFADENRDTFNYFIFTLVNSLSTNNNEDIENIINNVINELEKKKNEDSSMEINSELVIKMIDKYELRAVQAIVEYCKRASNSKFDEVNRQVYKVNTKKAKVGTITKTEQEKMSTKVKINNFEKQVASAHSEDIITEESCVVSQLYCTNAREILTEENDAYINEINKYAKNLLASLKNDEITHAVYEFGMNYCNIVIEIIANANVEVFEDVAKIHKIVVRNLKKYKESKVTVEAYIQSLETCLLELNHIIEMTEGNIMTK